MRAGRWLRWSNSGGKQESTRNTSGMNCFTHFVCCYSCVCCQARV